MRLHDPITLSPVAFDELRAQLRDRNKPVLTLWEEQQVTMEQPGNPPPGLIPCVVYFKTHKDLSAFLKDMEQLYPDTIIKREPV